ncbi:mitogen-activated protein kinase kinase kinase 3-like [Porites lutea]|uniref:mitogen-activated protein kinase kinase kinase 3-like n=1 Tax=Porites lutea TaxID=51062 RepID=UPI003CC55EAF
MKEVKMEPQYSKMPEEVKQLQNEIDKLSGLRHPRIVRFHGSEQKGDVIYLFLDFMAGVRVFEMVTTRCARGPNILLDSDRSVKLADFGVSRTIEKIGTKTDLTSYVGTTYWMAPEILWGEGYGRKVDIWSVGCTVVEMLTGNPPLRNLEPRAAMFRIGSKPLEVKLPESTEEAKDFVRAALTCTIRSVLEYACQVFHSSLPYYLSEELERIQKRALRIIFPYASYNSALKEAGIPSLYDRRASLSSDLFNDIVLDINHKLAGLLPPKAEHHRQLRSNRKFNVPVCKTDRLKKSFIAMYIYCFRKFAIELVIAAEKVIPVYRTIHIRSPYTRNDLKRG